MAKTKRKFWNSNKKESGTRYSSYWLGKYNPDNYRSIFSDDTPQGSQRKRSYDIFRLLEARQAISNFVRILTGKNDIIIDFKSSKDSDLNYTDGKTIVLSPNLEGDGFDTAVGLALHEASHIVHTDFETMRNNISSAINISTNHHFIKNIWNCIEDFYIDSMTYKTAPGYRGYYQALYNEFFGSNDIVKGFNSKKFGTVDWNSYMFHFCNIRNPKRNLNALPKLTEIWDVLDLANIQRLSTTQCRWNLAFQIYHIINSVIQEQNTSSTDGDNQQNESQQQMSFDDGDGEGSTGNGNDSDSDDLESELKDLSQSMTTRLEKLLQKQIDYFDGAPKKALITKEDSKTLKHLRETDCEIRVVGNTPNEDGDVVSSNGVRVLVIRNITPQMIETGVLGQYSFVSKNNGWYSDRYNSKVATGILNGKKLARRIQLRNEERITKTTRLKTGTIDRRLLSELASDNFQIFNKLNIKTYKPIHIHVSIDASGSMHGDRYENSLELAACLASASLLINNLHVVVSLRGTSGGEGIPYLCYIFDSSKHNLAHIREVFPYTRAGGSTPEGLCFEAIEKEIKRDALNNDSYFINLCDGEPACSIRTLDKKTGYSVWGQYSGYTARKHCRQQMLKMEKHGVKFLAYFFGSGYYGEGIKDCYGDRVVFMENAGEIEKVATTLNSKLLETLY